MQAVTTVAGRLVDGRAVRIGVSDGVIAEVEDLAGDAPDLFIAPGLIDLQVNGCAGIDVNDPDVTPNDIVALTRAQWDRGVARYFPTIVTASERRITHALRTVEGARQLDRLVGAAIPGVHVEGPHISPENGPRGAHDKRHVRAPNLDEFERWQRAGDGVVRMITVAPELDGALDYIAGVSQAGVLVAIGHTAADTQRISQACDAGASLSTHLGNGIHATLPRHPNPIWSQLSDKRLTASFIADGHHLPGEALITMVRAKARRRSFLVSDSTRLTGCDPGDYHEPVGGDVTLHVDGRLTMAGSSAMAGSAASLDQCVAWASTMLDGGLAEALELASDTPARLLGLRRSPGFRVGDPADITVFRRSGSYAFAPVATVLAGTLVAGEPESAPVNM